MPWIRPTGFEDPNDRWKWEGYGFDGNLATAPKCVGYDLLKWSDPLIFNFPHTFSDRLRVYFIIEPVAISYRFLAYDGEKWHWWGELDNPTPHEWLTIETEPHTVTKVQIVYRHGAVFPLLQGPAEINLWSECLGPLAPICDILRRIGAFFAGLAEDIGDWAIVGDALAAPFAALGELFQEGYEICCTASTTLQEILDLLEGGISWEEISALILEHWPNLAPLIDDPVAYITGIVSDLIPELPNWLDDPVAYITEIVSGLIPEMPDWLADPVAWLTDMLEENFPLLYYLIEDPAGGLLYLIALLFDLTPYEARSGEFVVKALFERYFPDLYLLWRELGLLVGLYEREGWVGLMTELKRRFYGLVERVVRFVWEGVWQE